MTIRDRILEYLSQHPEGADDDELAAALGFAQRQTANIYCRALAEQGIIQRIKKDRRKVRNFARDAAISFPELPSKQPKPPRTPTVSDSPGDSDPHDIWCWEGNVQSAVVRHLASHGYDILRVCHTASRERGKDIEARSGERALWVTVKGYPRDTAKTPATLQASHWFSGALVDIVCWRGENEKADLALALPDFPRYRTLAERVAWLKSAAGFHFIWVRQDGEVEIEW